MKQERRGGIETPAGPDSSSCSSWKQERRGGIETSLIAPTAPTAQVKQERRGGIETEQAERIQDPNDQEAGTPWWH